MARNGKPILLDGGMGQEIYNRGGKGGLWRMGGGPAIYEDPDLVREIHCDYIAAGADVLTTNTYGDDAGAHDGGGHGRSLCDACASGGPIGMRRARESEPRWGEDRH